MLLNFYKDTYRMVFQTVEYSAFPAKDSEKDQWWTFEKNVIITDVAFFTEKKVLVSRTDSSWNPKDSNVI